MPNITILNNREVLGINFTVYGDIDNPLFLAKNVAEMIEYDSASVGQMLEMVDDDEKVKIFTSLPDLSNEQKPAIPTGPANRWFLTEDGLYEVLMQSRKPIAKQFKKEVKAILKQLRMSGVVITESATDESIDFARLFGNRRIRKTFRESDNFRELYEQYKELSKIERDAKRITNKDRINACSIIIDELQNKVANEIQYMRPSEMLSIQELISDIQCDITKLTSKKAGGEKANLTRINNLLIEENKELKQQVEELTPPERIWQTVGIHGFSCNYSYQYTNTGVHISPAYNNWINTFPNDEIPSREEYEMYQGLDFSKPIGIEIQYVMMDKFDPRNFDKPFIDQVFLRCLGIDDAIVRKTDSYQIGSCNRYEDGKIIFAIYNL